jgi:predicted nucleotide-binding protein
LLQSLAGLRKQAATTGLSNEQLAQKIDEIDGFVHALKATSVEASLANCSRPSPAPATKNVFVIHGKDELNTLRLRDLLRDECHVNPVAMMAKPGMSRPLTDKFEEEASTCSFAFALFTPDDAVMYADARYGQARPNVIYETGWFIGRLGRNRVVLLMKEGAEMHTDLQGVSRILFRDDVKEKFVEIRQELKAAKLLK